MALNNTQRTRNDVDDLEINTISTIIDPYPTLKSPFTKVIPYDNITSKIVWFVNNNEDLESNNFTTNDVISFRFDFVEMSMKKISQMNLQFTISTDYKVNIENIGIIDLGDSYTNIQIAVNGTSDIDVAIDISNINPNDIISLINQSKFGIFVELSGGLINTNVIISNLKLVCKFENVLQSEIDAVRNRYTTFTEGLNFDDYVLVNELNNLPPLDVESDLGDIRSYIDTAIGKLDVDIDVILGMSGVDDNIIIRSQILKRDD